MLKVHIKNSQKFLECEHNQVKRAMKCSLCVFIIVSGVTIIENTVSMNILPISLIIAFTTYPCVVEDVTLTTIMVAGVNISCSTVLCLQLLYLCCRRCDTDNHNGGWSQYFLKYCTVFTTSPSVVGDVTLTTIMVAGVNISCSTVLCLQLTPV